MQVLQLILIIPVNIRRKLGPQRKYIHVQKTTTTTIHGYKFKSKLLPLIMVFAKSLCMEDDRKIIFMSKS